jgi:DNA-binding MarR family transcriptional regulator
VNRLLKRKLITRTRSSDDRRVLFLRTTPLGEELIAQLRQKRKERMTELFNHLNDEEAVIVTKSLKFLVKAIEAHREKSSN